MATWTRRRWASAATLVIGLAVLHPGATSAQAQVPRVGLLFLAAPEADNSQRAVAFREGMRELGYLEGQTVVFEYRHAGGKPERLSALATDLVRSRVNVIVAVGRIAEIAREHRLPSVFPFKEAVEAGGLMSYATSFAETQRRAATYVHRLLNGARPGDLSIEQANRFELVVNLRTARAIGLTVPPSILAQADQIIA
jgi:ABC-type uncharacterized transport system substrate-binding protein